MKALHQPTTISNDAFYFCRISVSVLLWLAFIFNLKWITVITFLIFLFSAILGINKAPLILLYSHKIGKFFPHHPKVTLDIKSIRFAHILATTFNFIIIFFYFISPTKIAYTILLFFSILKTISTLGYCPASKLYSCLTSNKKCCSFFPKKN